MTSQGLGYVDEFFKRIAPQLLGVPVVVHGLTLAKPLSAKSGDFNKAIATRGGELEAARKRGITSAYAGMYDWPHALQASRSV